MRFDMLRRRPPLPFGKDARGLPVEDALRRRYGDG